VVYLAFKERIRANSYRPFYTKTINFKIMQTITKGTFRFLGLASISLLVALNFSCESDTSAEKQSKEIKQTKGKQKKAISQPLIASANLEFTNNGDLIEFECYKEEMYGEISIQSDGNMYLRFRTVLKDGSQPDGPILQITIKNPNGFAEGEIYSFSDDPDNKEIIVSLTKSYEKPELYMAKNRGTKLGSGELKITSLRDKQIEGVFNFEIKNVINKEEKLIISNGKFQGKVVGLES